MSSKTHEKYTEEGVFRITNATESSRHATVEFTITWEDGSQFAGVMKDSMIRDVRSADFVHSWPTGI